MAEAAATIDMHPIWVNLEPAFQVLEGYEQAELDREVFACFAGYANSQGVCDPLQKTIAEKIGETAMNVNRSVHRLVDKYLIKILRKEKKYKDIHPRNITQINKALLRKEPDMRSSHFDAEKWKPFAARLKKFVSDAVDDMKQTVTAFAETMASAKKKQRAHHNRTWKQSSTPYYSELNKRGAHPPVYQGPKYPDISPFESRVEDSLLSMGIELWDKKAQDVWHYMRDKLSNEPSDEEYDALWKETVGKFNLQNTVRDSHPPVKNHPLAHASLRSVAQNMGLSMVGLPNLNS